VCCRIDKAGTDPRQVKQHDGSKRAMNELDFGGKRVLVVGGSSGIGNGTRRRSAPGARASMSAGHAPARAIIQLRKDQASKGWTIRNSTSAMRKPSRNSSRHSQDSTCWFWHRAR